MAIESINGGGVADYYTQAQQRQDQQDKQLSSGQRINSASDDAAGQQIGNRVTSELEQAQAYDRIYQNGIGQNDIESASLQNTTEVLADTQALVVQSGNGIYNSDDIEALQSQVNANLASIDNAEELGLTDVDISDPAAAEAALASAQSSVNGSNALLGAQSNAQAAASQTTQAAIEAQSAARSRLLDTDYAQTSAAKAQDEVLQQVALSVDKNRQEQANEQFNRLFS